MKGILYTKNYQTFEIQSESGECLLAFEGSLKANKSLCGDTVEWNSEKEQCSILNRAKYPPLAGLLDICSKTKYGITGRGHFLYLFHPFNLAYPPMIVGYSKQPNGINPLCLVEFLEWTDKDLPRGNLRTVLGPSGCKDVEEVALLWTYYPWRLSKAALTALEINTTQEFLHRIPTPELTFNIDPEGCQDIDDVLSLADTATHKEIWISIADVASMIPPNSFLDLFAKQQGQTAYLNGTAVQPMLPFELSHNKCSLLPGSMRPGVSLILYCLKNAPYTIQRTEWKVSYVANKTQYSYETFIEKGRANGIDIEFIQAVANQILPTAGNDTHKWIEAFMVYYNIQVAKLLRQNKCGLLRKHAGIDQELYTKYIQWDPSLSVLAMKAAEYCPATDSNPNHIGLQTDIYCHCTSPIRRYADLYSQRCLIAILQNLPADTSTIQDLCIQLNRRTRAAKNYEKESFLLEKLLDSTGIKTVDAILLSQTQKPNYYSIKLWIPDWKSSFTWKRPNILPYEPGTKICLNYFKNTGIANWKKRLVFELNM